MKRRSGAVVVQEWRRLEHLGFQGLSDESKHDIVEGHQWQAVKSARY